MGLIERSIRGRGNQKLAASVYTNTRLTRPQVEEKVKDVCEELSRDAILSLQQAKAGGLLSQLKAGEKTPGRVSYHLRLGGDEILIGYAGTPESIIALGNRRLKSSADHWLAGVFFPERQPETPPDQIVVGVRLKVWVRDNNGKLKNRDKYELLSAALFDAISVTAGL